jgi:hypothetical protein
VRHAIQTHQRRIANQFSNIICDFHSVISFR